MKSETLKKIGVAIGILLGSAISGFLGTYACHCVTGGGRSCQCLLEKVGAACCECEQCVCCPACRKCENCANGQCPPHDAK